MPCPVALRLVYARCAHLPPRRRLDRLARLHLAAKAVEVSLAKAPQLFTQEQAAVDMGDDKLPAAGGEWAGVGRVGEAVNSRRTQQLSCGALYRLGRPYRQQFDA